MAKKLWGGRFSKATDQAVEAFTESISYDFRLIEHDIAGSIAHAKMLGRQGIIPKDDSARIVDGLASILDDYFAGKIEFDPAAEDIHMNVEQILSQRIGPAAGRLHTARSRNDQIATDIRLFMKAHIGDIIELILNLQTVLFQAEQNLAVVLPGFTHMQHAQPVLLGHHLMAYFEMLDRDRLRLADCLVRLDVLPLGSGALAGTTFDIDRAFVANELGFARVSSNSMDSVADRDFISEFLADASVLMVHLSRFAEEFVIWNTIEFGFVELDDSVTTGSSIMPQKKNPDVVELIRGKSARVIGDLMSLLTLQKGLPLTYNRDLQEDKEPLFDAVDTAELSLQVFDLMLKTAKFNAAQMKLQAGAAFSTATDLADHLVRQGTPFRQAHAQVGELVAYCIAEGKSLDELSLEEIRKFAPDCADNVAESLSVEASVNARTAFGGTAQSEVERQIREAKERI